MKAKDIAFGGIMIALTVVTLYLTGLIPINTLALLTIASCYIPITIMRSNIKTSIFVYIASTMISFFMVPINYVILYGLFFGFYGIIKYFIEKLKNLPLEIILKLLLCNVVFTIILVIASLLGINLETTLSTWVLYIIAQPVFLVYDYALSLIINFYHQRFKIR